MEERNPPRRGRTPFLFFILMLLLIFGCQKSEKKQINETPLPDLIVNSTVDRAVITPADVARFTITVNSNPNINIAIPDLAKQFSGFRVIDYGTDQEKEAHLRKIKTVWYKLQADAVGSYLLPTVAVSYVTIKGEKKTIKSPRIFLEVITPESLKEEKDDIRDIKPLYIIPYDFRTVIYAIAAILLLAISILIWRWLRCRQNKKIPVPPVPPDEIARTRINALKIQWERKEISLKELHYGLSEAIRAYVEARYGIAATDMTLEEIRKKLASLPHLGVSVKSVLSELLGKTDRVKFTDYIPSELEIESLIALALSFVEEGHRALRGCDPAGGVPPCETTKVVAETIVEPAV